MSSRNLGNYADAVDPSGGEKNQDLEDDILKHLGRPEFIQELDKELIKNATPNYDDFNLKTSW